jgi:hypothetical protein
MQLGNDLQAVEKEKIYFLLRRSELFINPLVRFMAVLG